MLRGKVPIKFAVVICVVELSVGFGDVCLSAYHYRSRPLVSRFDYDVLACLEFPKGGCLVAAVAKSKTHTHI